MPTVLSTKKLKENQRNLLLIGGFSLVEYNAIKVDIIPFRAPAKIERAIFTSQNAVLAIQNANMSIQKCFCVGEKTKSLLEENGQKVQKTTKYASELADFIVKNHKNDTFHFFCGNLRSNEIPSKLEENNIAFKEITVYKTTLIPKKNERHFDAILFFSPSGVKSYFSNNFPIEGGAGGCLAVCIGTTTASEAKKYIENVVVANDTTVESVIAKAVKILKN